MWNSKWETNQKAAGTKKQCTTHIIVQYYKLRVNKQ